MRTRSLIIPIWTLVGAYDQNPKNLAAFCRNWPVRPYSSLDELVADATIEMVLNLTDPRSHFDVTAALPGSGQARLLGEAARDGFRSSIETRRIGR